MAECLGDHDVLAAAARRPRPRRPRAGRAGGGRASQPDAVVNAAAMTNVDACERDPERAFAVNALGVRHLAVAAERAGAHVVHSRTDYVFDGDATDPYDEWDAVAPLSEYGRSKLGGERRARGARELVGDRPHVVGVRQARERSHQLGVRCLRARRAQRRARRPGEHPHLRARSRRAARAVRGAAPPGPVPRHQRVRGVHPPRAHHRRAADPRPRRRQRGADHRRSPTARPGAPLYSALDNRALRLGQLPGLRPWRDALGEYVKEWS